MDPIVLASSSPRRQEILKLLNIPFVVNPADIDESIPEDIKAEDVPEFLAVRKIDAVARRLSASSEAGWILAADTVIVYKNRIFGKPESREQAKEFLKTLQGTTHKVITGTALYNGKLHDYTSRTSINKVTFAPMTDSQIEWYLDTSEWYGAAGAYRIQGLGSCFIKKLEGTESSVMGLPVFDLYDMLHEQNYGLV